MIMSCRGNLSNAFPVEKREKKQCEWLLAGWINKSRRQNWAKSIASSTVKGMSRVSEKEQIAARVLTQTQC